MKANNYKYNTEAKIENHSLKTSRHEFDCTVLRNIIHSSE
jgi:hypothetical protein